MKFNQLKKGSMFLVFLFILSLSLFLVNAQPPFQQSEPLINTLEIRIAAPESITLLEGFDLHAHVFNTTDGLPLNSGIDCYLHLYNTEGKHIFEGVDNTSSHTWDYGWDIPTSNLTFVGEMPYLVQCNNSLRGGFVASSIMITPDGYQFRNNLWILILGLMISAFIIILGFAKDDPPLVILGSFGLVFVGLWILFNGIAGIRNPTTTRAIGIIVLMVAGYIGIKSAYELVSDK